MLIGLMMQNKRKKSSYLVCQLIFISVLFVRFNFYFSINLKWIYLFIWCDADEGFIIGSLDAASARLSRLSSESVEFFSSSRLHRSLELYLSIHFDFSITFFSYQFSYFCVIRFRIFFNCYRIVVNSFRYLYDKRSNTSL